MTGKNPQQTGQIPPIYRTSATNTMDHSNLRYDFVPTYYHFFHKTYQYESISQTNRSKPIRISNESGITSKSEL